MYIVYVHYVDHMLMDMYLGVCLDDEVQLQQVHSNN